MREFVIGTRGSALALWQAHRVEEMLRERIPEIAIRIEIIHTKGDRILDVALSRIGDRALFTKELEQALIERTVDLAVHSLKDLPTRLPEGLELGAITERHAPEDALVAERGMSLGSLREGATVATSSLRRRAQLLALRPDLTVVDVRGNVQTRLERRRQNGWEGMILARAGLERLGLASEIAEVIPTMLMLPAVGQGALGIECRSDDTETLEVLATIEHEDTRRCTAAERSLLRELEGGCQIPIGAHATISSGRMSIDGLIAALDGSEIVRRRSDGDAGNPEALGAMLAGELLAAGGDHILEAVRAAGV
jgi:hydroxymethylbilane synthase